MKILAFRHVLILAAVLVAALVAGCTTPQDDVQPAPSPMSVPF